MFLYFALFCAAPAPHTTASPAPPPFRLLPLEARQVTSGHGYKDAQSIYSGMQWISADPILNADFIQHLTALDASIRYADLLQMVPADKREPLLKLLQERNCSALQAKSELASYETWVYRQMPRRNDQNEKIEKVDAAELSCHQFCLALMQSYQADLATLLGPSMAQAFFIEERAQALDESLRDHAIPASLPVRLRLYRLAVATADETQGASDKFIEAFFAKLPAAGFSPQELESLGSLVKRPSPPKTEAAFYFLAGVKLLAYHSTQLDLPSFWDYDSSLPLYPQQQVSP